MLSVAVEDDEKSWDLNLPFCMLAYRTSIHDNTGTSPFELMYGWEVCLPAVCSSSHYGDSPS